MKKRALSLLLASAAAAACFFCGCGGESNGSIIILDGEKQTQTTVLAVYGHRTDRYSLSVIEDTLQSFMTANSDINVTYESATESNYWQSLDRRYKTDNLDDVFMIDRDHLIYMTAGGELANLKDVVDENIFDEIALSQLHCGDGIYAVPTAVSTYGLYINYGLLDRNGQQVPRNLSEFTAVCNYFVSNGVTPIVCSNPSSVRSLILARGMYGTYCTAEDTAKEIEKFNAAPAALADSLNDGVDFIYEMISNRWISLSGSTDELELFAAGDRPFMITEGQASAMLKEKLSKSGKELSYGVHAYPILNSGSVLVAQADSLISVKKGPNEITAKKLVSLISNPKTLLNLNYGQSCFSPLKQTPFNSDSAIIPSASYLNKGKYVLNSDVNLKVPLDSILNECSALIIGGESSADTKAHLLNLLSEVSR